MSADSSALFQIFRVICIYIPVRIPRNSLLCVLILYYPSEYSGTDPLHSPTLRERTYWIPLVYGYFYAYLPQMIDSSQYH